MWQICTETTFMFESTCIKLLLRKVHEVRRPGCLIQYQHWNRAKWIEKAYTCNSDFPCSIILTTCKRAFLIGAMITAFCHFKNDYYIRCRIRPRSSGRWSWHSRHWPWDGTSWCTGYSTPLASMGALAAPRQSRCSGSWSESAQQKTASHF